MSQRNRLRQIPISKAGQPLRGVERAERRRRSVLASTVEPFAQSRSRDIDPGEGRALDNARWVVALS